MTQILVTKPGQLTASDRRALRKAGVVSVEADDPSSVKLIQPTGAEIGGGDMLWCALSTLANHSHATSSEYFVKKLVAIMGEQRVLEE